MNYQVYCLAVMEEQVKMQVENGSARSRHDIVILGDMFLRSRQIYCLNIYLGNDIPCPEKFKHVRTLCFGLLGVLLFSPCFR